MRLSPGRALVAWDRIRSSYWFVPTLMALGATVAAVLAVRADALFSLELFRDVEWLQANQPAGARSLLSTIAGSMITVAGVTFSITIAAVSYASSQYGPRLLTNFMRDTGNQVTLGTFIATFLYCLLVLRGIRDADEVTGLPAFVPHMAVTGGMLLGIASLGVLIYFIHHTTKSIHVSHLIGDIGRDLGSRVEGLLPEEDEPRRRERGLGAAARSPREMRRGGRVSTGPGGREAPNEIRSPGEEDDEPSKALPDRDLAVEVKADREGYVQHVDLDRVRELAQKRDLVILVLRGPGDFLARCRAVFLVYGGSAAEGGERGTLQEELERELLRTVAYGSLRTPQQDVLFLADELAEIAARALSPGVNDPFTAMNCLDWLGSAVSLAAAGRFPESRWYDDDGHLRVIAPVLYFTELVRRPFNQLRPYVSRDRNAALHTFHVLTEIVRDVHRDDQIDAVEDVTTGLYRTARKALPDQSDKEELERAWSLFRGALEERRARLRRDTLSSCDASDAR